MPGGKEYAFRVTDGARIVPVVYRGIAPDTFTDGVDVVVEGRMGDGRHLPRDDAARQVRVALRERARRREKYKQTPGYKAASGAKRVILVGELSLWVALLMAAWAATMSFAGGALRREDLIASGVRGLYATFAMVILASIGLWTALLTHDFSLEYVASQHQREHAEASTSSRRSGAGRRDRCSSGR